MIQDCNLNIQLSPMLAATIQCDLLSAIAARDTAAEYGGVVPADDALVIAGFVCGLQGEPPALVLRGAHTSAALGHLLVHVDSVSDAENVEILYGEAHDDGDPAAATRWADLSEAARAELIAQGLELHWRITPALEASFASRRKREL